MSTSTSHPTPSTRDIRLFALLLSLFGLALAFVVMRRSGALTVAAMFLIIAWSISLAFNAGHRRRAIGGAVLPLGVALLAALLHMGLPQQPTAGALVVICGVAAAISGLSPAHGRRLYDGWMRAAEPIGWSVSTVVLTLTYYLAVTPIGLMMKLTGYDPMQRTPDRQAATYWVQRPPPADKPRYFRQF